MVSMLALVNFLRVCVIVQCSAVYVCLFVCSAVSVCAVRVCMCACVRSSACVMCARARVLLYSVVQSIGVCLYAVLRACACACVELFVLIYI